MKKKLTRIFMCMLMIFNATTTIFYSYNVNVQASEEKSYEGVGLDYDFIYNTVTKDLSEIIFHSYYGINNGIWMGRSFGSIGEQYSADKIIEWITQNTNNLNVIQIKKERVGNESDNLPNFNPMKRVNNNMEILSYSVDLREGYSSTPDVIIPTNESFIFPIKTTDPELEESTITSNGPIKIRWPPIGYNEESQNEDDIDFSAYNLNVTKYTMAFTILNESETFIIGETVYLENYSNATSQEKEGKNHLINCSNDDYNDTVELLHEDNATGFILIRDNVSILKNWSFNLPGVAVSQQNGSKLKNLTQNGTVNIFISDYNISQGAGILDVYHCTDDLTLFENKIWLVNSDWLENKFGGLVIRTYVLPAAAFLLCSPVYPQTHFQYPYASNKILRGEDASYSRLKKPIISINGSVVLDGQNKDVWEWVQENYYTDHPVTLNYEFTQRKNPAIVSYNVYCDIQGKNTNKWLIMSGGHYDGWYGQMTCDDAVGVGQMIGILKYLNDNEITPRYNTRFIFHSGEENVDRGSISHVYNMSNREVLSKAKYIINLDQLGHNHPASFRINTTRPRLFDKNLQKIVEEITMISGYDEKYESKGYKVSIGGLLSNGTTDCVPYTTTKDGNDIPFKQVDLQYINFCKDSFPMYHQTGVDHTMGDTLNIVDREDINATVDIIWNVSKYFIVDPDCHFDSITYQKIDSPNDENNDYDAVRITYAIETTIPSDHVKVRAILTSQDHPILSRYSNDATHVVTNSITSYQTLTVSLPKTAPAGYYDLSVYLYNSTGEIDNILENSYDQGIYADDSFYVNNILLSPPNDAPTKPTTPNGPTDIDPWLLHFYSTSSTDLNDDCIRYQWQWTEGNNDNWQFISWLSGATAWGEHSWLGETGNIQIRVRARDVWSHPDFCSSWSDPLTVGISEGCWFTAPTESLCGEPVQFTGYATGGVEPYTWEWKYSSSLGYEENSSTTNHTYNIPDSNTVSLKVTDDERTVMYYNTTIEIKDVLSDYIANQTSVKSNSVISFNDASVVYRDYYIKNWTWDFDDGNISYTRNVTHVYQNDGEYNVTLTVVDNEDHSDVSNQIIHVDTTPPMILAVRNTKNTVAQDFNMTINAEFFDNQSDIDSVKVNITYPDNTTGNYSMNYTETGIYSFIYEFNDTEQMGQYNYTIWVTDHAGNMNNTTGFSFTVVPQPFISFDTPPTPPNQIVCNQNWVLVNTTVQDNTNTSAFIDWNNSLKGYWPMESYNDTGVYDNSTYENFGRFQNGMNTRNIIPGKYGDGLEFDGSDDYLDVGTSNSLDLGTGDFTFIVWEKSHATSYSKKAMILTNNPAMESWKGYGFGVMNNPYLIVSQSSGNNITLQGTTDVTDNTWHHIAYVCRSGAYSIYVDGEEDASSGGIAVKNITNAQHTMIAYDGHCSSWCYFEGALDEPQLYNRALSWKEINASYNNGINRLSHNFTGLSDGTYSYYAHAIDTTGNQSNTEVRQILIDTTPPTITDVTASPHTVGFGYNMTITADVVDNGSGVDLVTIQIIPPSGVGNSSNDTMTLVSNNTYQYVFNDTWSTGQYNYTIWATDNTNNTASSSGHHFHDSAEATISIATLRNSYSGNQYINITDPPNPPEDYTLVDRGLTWNTYYNATSGENILETYQGPVNYQEDNGTWTPINNTFIPLGSNHPAYVYGYRNGNDHGLYGVYFKSNAQQEWPVAFTFNHWDDPTIHAIRSKLVGVGYVDPQSNWAYQYLQNVQSSQGQTNDYSITYSGVFTGTDVTWSYGNTGLKEEITLSNVTKTVLQNHPPSQYGLNDVSSYLVFITKLDHQSLNFYNDSGLLEGNVTISDAGVEFRDILGQFKCALPLGEAYELNNETARQKLTYRIIHLNGNTYLLSGLKLSDLNAMTFPVVVDPTLTVYSLSSDGYIYNSGSSYNTVQSASTGTVDSSSSYLTIGQKKVALGPTYYVYRGFVFFNTSTLPSNVYLDDATLSLYKKDDYSTTDFDITIQNGQPTYPRNPMQSADYNKNYYSGNGGTLSTSGFTNGYNAIRMNNLSWINKTGITKLCLRSSRDISGTAPTGNEYVNVHSSEFLGMNPPRLVINYRNQSKIKNTGSTDINGYLLIQIQFYNSTQGKWLLDDDTINETTARTITSSSQLALDTLFNGHVRASDLTHGTGTYRVYAAFRDPEGNILRTNDGTELKAWWQFNKT